MILKSYYLPSKKSLFLCNVIAQPFVHENCALLLLTVEIICVDKKRKREKIEREINTTCKMRE